MSLGKKIKKKVQRMKVADSKGSTSSRAVQQYIDSVSNEVEGLSNILSDIPILDGQLIEFDWPVPYSSANIVVLRHNLKREFRGFIDLLGQQLSEDASNPNKNREIWIKSRSSITPDRSYGRIWIF